MSPERRGSLYLLTGLVIGIALGLLYAWLIRPLQYVDTTPATLQGEAKERYRALIAGAYQANADIGRARARLALLDDAEPARALAEQAQRALAQGGAPVEAHALALLAAALGQQPPVVTPMASITPMGGLSLTPSPSPSLTPLPLPASQTPTLTPPLATPTVTPQPSPSLTLTLATAGDVTTGTLATAGTPTARTPSLTPLNYATTLAFSLTPLPSKTPTPTLGAPFVLKTREQDCAAAQPLLEVYVSDAANQPVPGVEVHVSWSGGEDHFFTGLKPEIGLGYADFLMTPGVAYSLHVGEGGQPVNDLTAPTCTGGSGSAKAGGIVLNFIQP